MDLKRGDIFEFQISENSLAYGQITSEINGEILVIIIYKSLYSKRPDISEIVDDEILLFGNTFDAKLYHKHWIVIGNEELNLDKIEYPYYKIGVDPVFVEDFEKNKLRKATKEEESKLAYRSNVAPVRFELALKAYYKIIPWNEKFDNLLYSRVLSSIKIFRKRGGKKTWFCFL